ncbi:MAG: SLC13 family permease [bacterium]
MAIALVLIILTAATLLFVRGWLRPDLVALLVPVTLYAAGVITRDEALSGFIRPAVILLIAAFIITEAVRQTGPGEYMSALLVRITGTSERLLMLSLSLCAAILSLFMNNIAAAAVLMPSGIAAMLL